jgi:hypothetical protein
VPDASTFNVTSLSSPTDGRKLKQNMSDDIWSLQKLNQFFELPFQKVFDKNQTSLKVTVHAQICNRFATCHVGAVN